MRFSVAVLCASMSSVAVNMAQYECDMEVEACKNLRSVFPGAAGRVGQYKTLGAAADACAKAGGEYCYITFQGGLVLEAGVNCANEAGYSIPGDNLEGWTVGSTVTTSISFVDCATSKAVYVLEKSSTSFCANPANGNRVEATINEKNIVLPEGSYPAAGLVIDGCGDLGKNYQFTLTLNRAFGTPRPVITTSTEESVVDEESEESEDSEAAASDSTDSPASESSVTGEGGTTTTSNDSENAGCPAAAEGFLAASLATGVIVVLGNL